MIERAVLLDRQNPLRAELLARVLGPGADASARRVALPDDGVDLAELERDLIRQALERTRGNRTRAAALLGLTRDTLRYRIEKHGL